MPWPRQSILRCRNRCRGHGNRCFTVGIDCRGHNNRLWGTEHRFFFVGIDCRSHGNRSKGAEIDCRGHGKSIAVAMAIGFNTLRPMAVAKAIDSNSGKSFIKIEISGHNLKQFCALAHGRPDENPQSEKVSGKHPSSNKKKKPRHVKAQ